jgi:hypothetical protein
MSNVKAQISNEIQMTKKLLTFDHLSLIWHLDLGICNFKRCFYIGEYIVKED